MKLFQKIWQWWINWCAFCDYSAFQRAASACVPLAADGFHQETPQPVVQKQIYMTKDEFLNHFDKRLPKFKHVYGAARRNAIWRVFEDILEMSDKAKDD
jgi:hypothetical protein